MPESFRPCQWPGCDKRASGLWLLTYVNGKHEFKLLCAAAGFTEAVAHVKVIPTDNGMICYHDIVRVDLIQSFTTDFVPPDIAEPLVPMVIPVTVQRSRKPMKPLRAQFATDPNFDPNPEWLR